MTVIAMVLDDILRQDKEGTNIQGLHLYQALTQVGRLALLCGEDKDRADWFLKTNGLTQHVYLIPEDEMQGATKAERRMAQIRTLRSHGGHVEMVFETDPEVAAHLYREQIPVLLYLHPIFSRPSFRPDYKNEARPWNDLIAEVEYQKKMLAERVIEDEPL